MNSFQQDAKRAAKQTLLTFLHYVKDQHAEGNPVFTRTNIDSDFREYRALFVATMGVGLNMEPRPIAYTFAPELLAATSNEVKKLFEDKKLASLLLTPFTADFIVDVCLSILDRAGADVYGITDERILSEEV